MSEVYYEVHMTRFRFFSFVPRSKNKTKNIFLYFFTSLPSTKLIISLISIHKHDTMDIDDPSNRQDACHMNFVIDLAHRRVSVAQW